MIARLWRFGLRLLVYTCSHAFTCVVRWRRTIAVSTMRRRWCTIVAHMYVHHKWVVGCRVHSALPGLPYHVLSVHQHNNHDEMRNCGATAMRLWILFSSMRTRALVHLCAQLLLSAEQRRQPARNARTNGSGNWKSRQHRCQQNTQSNTTYACGDLIDLIVMHKAIYAHHVVNVPSALRIDR